MFRRKYWKIHNLTVPIEKEVTRINCFKIGLSSNDYKRMQSIDSIETYTYGTSKDLVSDREEIKCYKIIKRYNKKD